jgi:hypothetical protein
MTEPSEHDRAIFARELESRGEQRLAEMVRDGTDNSNGGTAALVAIAAARAEGRRETIEECARVVGHHPFADDASEVCMDAQGCCETMEEQIRALAGQPAPAAPEPSEAEVEAAWKVWIGSVSITPKEATRLALTAAAKVRAGR